MLVGVARQALWDQTMTRQRGLSPGIMCPVALDQKAVQKDRGGYQYKRGDSGNVGLWAGYEVQAWASHHHVLG